MTVLLLREGVTNFMNINEAAKLTKKASTTLAAKSTELKNRALLEIAESLKNRQDEIIIANKVDLERSEGDKLATPLLKRLKFDETKIQDVIDGIKSLISLPDPVGQVLSKTELDEGLILNKISCPIGVIGVIFESRPDALVQISTLCLKSGNGVLLKGGSEAKETNRVLTDIIKRATQKVGLQDSWIQLLESRSDVQEMLKLDEYIDLIIPRGSNDFVRYIMDNSRISVLGHADGICHCYVDNVADIDMALKVVIDSKTQYVAACNALETLLVHKDIAEEFLPRLMSLADEKGVTLVGCEQTRGIIEVLPATQEDWKTEYLDLKLSIKLVDNLIEAVEHINTYGSGHTDSIITNNLNNAETFMNLVDSGSVFFNCSTRFSDGFRYGFGAEVGISTNKIHARGPVGLDGLLIYKYKLIGDGHIVDDYATRKRVFTHKKFIS